MRVLLPLKKGLITSNSKSDTNLFQQQVEHQERPAPFDNIERLEPLAAPLESNLETRVKETLRCCSVSYCEKSDNELSEFAEEVSHQLEPKSSSSAVISGKEASYTTSASLTTCTEQFNEDAIKAASSDRPKRKSCYSNTVDSIGKKISPTSLFLDNLKNPSTRIVEPFGMAGGRQNSNNERRWSSNDSACGGASGSIDIMNDDYYENDPTSAFDNPLCDSRQGRREADLDDEFRRTLKRRGLEIIEQEGDGNCLFRAVSLQIYGDPNMHSEVRQQCLDFMSKDEEHFSQFVTDEPFGAYILRKRQDGVHGNNPEIQAISELFNRPVEVFVPQYGATPLNIFHAEYKTSDAPIRLSYHDGNHYNAVVDPFVPTAGLGLGFPGLQLGLADKLQVARAVTESDNLADQMEMKRALEDSQNDQLQRAIKESTLSIDSLHKDKAIALSDIEATNFELEQAVLVKSMESFRSFEQGRKPSSVNLREGHIAAHTAGRHFEARNQEQNSPVASLPSQSESVVPAAASPPLAVASVAARIPDNSNSLIDGSADEYPPTVQELVMNGFDLGKVVHAYELLGDNFDDLLAFLMQSTSR